MGVGQGLLERLPAAIPLESYLSNTRPVGDRWIGTMNIIPPNIVLGLKQRRKR
jgi:hypothetical protein